MYKNIVYIFAMLATFSSAYNPYENSIVWVKAPDSQTLLLNQIPAGLEDDVILFLCRIQCDHNLVSGKLLIKNGNISCIVPYNTYTQASSTEFEVLVTYPEVVSWRAFTGGITENTIRSGWMGDEKSYVCRAKIGKNLIPGRFDTRWLCHVAYNGSECSRAEDVEILERNFLGITMKTTLPEHVDIKTVKLVSHDNAPDNKPENDLINLSTILTKFLHRKLPILNFV